MQLKNSIIAVAFMMLATVPSRAGTISFLPLTSTVTAGQSITLNVQIVGATDLYGYQFDIGFDPAILAAQSVSEGSFLPTGGSTTFFSGTVDNTDGSIANNADILDGAISGVNGNGTLLSVTFQALMAGSSNISLFNLTALNSFGQGLTETTDNATIAVLPSGASPVPEPGTFFLLTTGVLGLLVTLNRTPMS